MALQDLYWSVLWWFPEYLAEEPRFKSVHLPLRNIPIKMLPEKGGLHSIQYNILRAFNLPPDESRFAIWPSETRRGPVDDNVSFAELLAGQYGEITKEKPLIFLLAGRWTVDQPLEKEVLLRKLDRMVYPNKTKLRNWMSGVNQDDAPSAETGQSNLGSTVAIDLTASLPNTVQQDITAADEWPVYDPRKYETANQATPKASPITHQPEAELNPGIARDVHIIQDEAAVPRLSSAGVDHIHDLDTPPPYTDVAEDWASIPTPTPPSTRSTAVSTNDIATALPSGIHPFAPAPVFQTPSIKLTLQGKPPVTRCSGVSLPGAFPLD